MLLSVLLASASALAAPATIDSKCRCTPGQACWAAVPWSALNASVGGRLERSVDELQACIDDEASEQCTAALNMTDDEFWLGSKPNGYQHTGLFGVWNTSKDRSEYSVKAQTEQDFVETVQFAGKHNLRLVVKATGHDWYGRSTAAGSLLLWTHQRKKITWQSSFPAPEGKGVPAVTVQSGVQFSDMYPAAQTVPYPGDTANPQRKTVVMGGTCDSVGVGGCWLGGCYGPFTKKAKLVLPNGTLITASEKENADVFWTLRGGGGANIAAVTEFTARTHPAPNYVIDSGLDGKAKDLAGFKILMDKVLQENAKAMEWSSAPGVQDCGGAGPHFSANTFSAGWSCNQWEGDAKRTLQLYDPMVKWCKEPAQVAAGISCSAKSSRGWKQADYGHDRPPWDGIHWVPWIELHPDREISTAVLGSMTKYFPMRGMKDKQSRAEIIAGQIKIDAILGAMGKEIATMSCIMGAKSQSGMPPKIVERFKKTSNNPALLDTVGLWLIMFNIPSLPSLGVWTPKVLKALLPRLKTYALKNKSDALLPVNQGCEAGAAGDGVKAAACYHGWMARVPGYIKQVSAIRKALWEAFPNTKPVTAALPSGVGGGDVYSGSYWNEADYADPDFTVSHWGPNYKRLLALKKKHDPHGLYYGHHAVGSELWDARGNCRKN